VLGRGQQMLNVVRQVDEASRRSSELGEPAAHRPSTTVNLELLTALSAEPFDADATMERLVSSADND